MIERSFAIKCPNISLHLVGAKIVQQVKYFSWILQVNIKFIWLITFT